jgi:fibronectin type 3 domain-containing protein
VSGASGYNVYRATSSGGSYSNIGSISGVSYTDTKLPSNTTYYYKVSAWNSSGESSQSTSYGSATTSSSSSEPEIPAAPTGVTATVQSSDSIYVSWGSVPGASGYHVYRAYSSYGSYSEFVSKSDAFYTDTRLPSNTTYYYKVSAWNSSGESSQSTSYGSATTLSSSSEPEIPAAPTGIMATAQSSDSIYVSWNSVSGASEYYIYRANSSYGSYSVIVSTSDAFYTDTELTSNTTYYYKVSAYNSVGEGGQSSYTSATTPVGVPIGVTASVQSSSSINISWEPESGVSGYNVYRADSSDGYYSSITSTNSTSYTNTGLASNTTYYYKVSVGYGGSSQSDYVSATTYVNAPTGVTATAQSSDSISVSWSSVSGATGYYVYRADSSGGSYSELASTSDASYTDTDLTSNTTYYYKVSAYNSVGEGGQSSSVSATTSLSVPAGVTATAQSSSSINISWEPVSGASVYNIYRATSSDGYYSNITYIYNDTSYTDTGRASNTAYYYKVSAGGSSQSDYVFATTYVSAPTGVTATAQSSDSINVSWSSVSGATGYYVYRADSSGGSYSELASTSDASYTDTELTSNTTYYYKVSAYNSVGEGGQSSYTYATTSLSVPAGVTAEAQSPSSIYVSWEPVSGASGYYVYRADSSDGYYSSITNTNSTSYTNTGLTSGTTYYYKIKAYSSVRESALSSYTNATTPPTPGTLNIVVGFNLGVEITGSNGANTIRQTTGAPSSLALSAAGYTDVVWYVDGNASAPINSDTITINASDYTTKLHSVTFTGYKNGTPYAQVIPFTVLY